MKAIGIKLVDVVHMHASNAVNLGYKTNNVTSDGYEITYPNGSKSWHPAEEVERTYFAIVNDSKITDIDVDNFLIKGEVSKLGNKTAVVIDSTLTGFDMVETSACVSAENFNKEIGAQYAREKIKSRLWGHLGFVLQWAINGLSASNAKSLYAKSDFEEVYDDEYRRLEKELKDLDAFILDNPSFLLLDETAQRTLKERSVRLGEQITNY